MKPIDEYITKVEENLALLKELKEKFPNLQHEKSLVNKDLFFLKEDYHLFNDGKLDNYFLFRPEIEYKKCIISFYSYFRLAEFSIFGLKILPNPLKCFSAKLQRNADIKLANLINSSKVKIDPLTIGPRLKTFLLLQ